MVTGETCESLYHIYILPVKVFEQLWKIKSICVRGYTSDPEVQALALLCAHYPRAFVSKQCNI